MTYRTPLYDMHVAAEARMVAFAGFSMPLQYPQGVLAESLHTRRAAGLFDVSHMAQVILSGKNIAGRIEALLPVDCSSIEIGEQRYTLMTNADGGIRDDLVLTRLDSDRFMLVLNAANTEADLDYLRGALPEGSIEHRAGHGLLALQGPGAEAVLEKLLPGCRRLTFMRIARLNFAGEEILVSRSGYTGEDGFELYADPVQLQTLARALLAQAPVAWAGLAARDALRLEAGLCLHGQDLDESTTPPEARLKWCIAPARRAGATRAGGFPGAHAIAAGWSSPSRRRCGFAVDGKAPVRAGAKVLDNQGRACGTVTSGGFSPTLGKPVAMGYLDSRIADDDLLFVSRRGRDIPLSVTALPFVAHRYKR